MGFLISLAAKAVGERFAPLLAYALVIAVLVGAIWWLRADAYSDGEAANDAKWVAAGEEAERQAREAAGRASAASVKRVEQNNARVAQEKEKLDAAEASGSSPLDVLFGS
ncbi:hypothetical protein vBEliSR6L_72 [Erythrobacter phage vB_EliS_R6L]|nr:hypothetical protein vBEliSR6L_72 [Erythrobacter phage vB_EliS_R6L]